jgi:hypothetical protein
MNRVISLVGSKDVTDEANETLELAMNNLKEVIIIGTNQDGNLYIDSSGMNYINALGLLEIAKFKLMEEMTDSA